MPTRRSPRPTSTAKRRLAELGDKLRYSVTAPAGEARARRTRSSASSPRPTTWPRCCKAKEYIAAGDMMQVQIGQRLRKRYTESPLSACTARCAR